MLCLSSVVCSTHTFSRAPTHTPEQTLGLAPTAEHGAILGFETQPLVSTDYVNDVRSSIVDAASTMVVGDSMVKIYAWYDNEAGYSMRTAELARIVAKKFL